MNQLPTGLYQPGNSVFYRLNAGTKILCLALLQAAVISTSTLWGFGFLVLLMFAFTALSKIRKDAAFQSISRLRWFFLAILLMNLFFFQPDQAWFRWWVFQPSAEGLRQGILVVFRVLLMIVFSNLLMVTTTPLELTKGLEWLLQPLAFIGIPTGLIAMILSVAIQFVPTIFEETDRIRKAQIARGAKFESNNWFDKGKAVIPLVVPVFLTSFQRADELSLAMEARGYRPDINKRHRIHLLFRKPDAAALCVCALTALLMMIL